MVFAVTELYLTLRDAWRAADVRRRLASWWCVVSHRHASAQAVSVVRRLRSHLQHDGFRSPSARAPVGPFDDHRDTIDMH